MEGTLAKNLDLNSGHQLFSNEDETPLSSPGLVASATTPNLNQDSSLKPYKEEKPSSVAEDSHVCLMGLKGENVEPSRALDQCAKGGLSTDLNEVGTELEENSMPIEISEPREAEAGSVPVVGLDSGSVELRDVAGGLATEKELVSSKSDQEGVNAKKNPSLRLQVERHEEVSAGLQNKSGFGDEKHSTACSNDEQAGFYNCTPRERRFSVGDMVWGKVKYHPWFPGQVCDPSDASELASRRCYKDRVLVAYFGDQTFAWCKESDLKPFQQNFAEMAKQSGGKPFLNGVYKAVNEFSRRIEFGLTCSCRSEQIHRKLESKAFINSGLRKGTVVNNHRDISLAVTEFDPQKLLAYIREWAECPHIDDTLQITRVCAQMSAFSAAERPLVCEETSFETPRKGSRTEGSGRKQVRKTKKRMFGDSFEPVDDVSEHGEPPLKYFKNISGTPLNNLKEKGSSGRKQSLSTPRKPRKNESIFASGGYRKALKSKQGKNRMNHSTPRDWDEDADTKKVLKVSKLGECLRKIASQLTGSPPIIKACVSPVQNKTSEKSGKKTKSVSKEGIPRTPSAMVESASPLIGDFSVKELLSDLFLVAQKPMYFLEENDMFARVPGFFLKFRDAVFQKDIVYSSYRKVSPLKLANQVPKKRSSRSSPKLTGSSNMCNLEDMEMPDNKSLLPMGHRASSLKRKVGVQVEDARKKRHIRSPSPSLSKKSSKKTINEVPMTPIVPANNVLDSPAESNAKQSPTALFMKFPVEIAVPSELELKEKFSCYGEISETEIFVESGCAQVVFQRCSDAETAFHSATTNRFFGPETVCFRLRYLSSRSKANIPETAVAERLEISMPEEERNISRNVEDIKENAVQATVSEVPAAKNFGASKSNLMEEPSLLLSQQSLEMTASA